jgi:hypothetical protein
MDARGRLAGVLAGLDRPVGSPGGRPAHRHEQVCAAHGSPAVTAPAKAKPITAPRMCERCPTIAPLYDWVGESLCPSCWVLTTQLWGNRVRLAEPEKRSSTWAAVGWLAVPRKSDGMVPTGLAAPVIVEWPASPTRGGERRWVSLQELEVVLRAR